MDALIDLPEVKSEKTPVEREVLAKYFDAPDEGDRAPLARYIDWKTLGVATGISLFTSMPFLENLFEKLPYGTNGLGQVAMRAVLFFILLLGYMMWTRKNK